MALEVFCEPNDEKGYVTICKYYSGTIDGHSNFYLESSVMPVYCEICGCFQSKLYKNLGSRYGFVGSFLCEYCGSSVAVRDNDGILDSVVCGSIELNFSALYGFSPSILNLLGKKIRLNLFAFLEDKPNFPLYCLADELISISGIGYNTDLDFIAEAGFPVFPGEALKWLTILEAAGMKGFFLDGIKYLMKL